MAKALVDDEVDDVGWAVRHALQQAERQARRTAMIDELTASGVAVVEHDGFGIPNGMTELDGYRGLGLDPDAHAGDDCHVVVVTRDGDQRPACREPARHARKGGSELKVVKPPRTESEDDIRRKAEQKAVREAAQARAKYLGELLGRRLPKASVTTLVLGAFLRSANQAAAKAACDLLGLKAPSVKEDAYGTRAVDELMGYADAGDAHLQRAALALAFAMAEEHMGVSWGVIGWARPAVIAHLRFLEDTGYRRSEFEDDRLAEAAEPIEVEAADRRRWQERRTEANEVTGGMMPSDGDDDGEPLADDGLDEIEDDDALLAEPA